MLIRQGDKSPIALLTNREKDILRLLAIHGWTDKEIAIFLGIAGATVGKHMEALRRELHLSSRTQLAIWAFKHPDAVRVGSTSLSPHPDPCLCGTPWCDWMRQIEPQPAIP